MTCSDETWLGVNDIAKEGVYVDYYGNAVDTTLFDSQLDNCENCLLGLLGSNEDCLSTKQAWDNTVQSSK